jgi:abortive infection bacteriophage resistance protein
MDVLHMPSLDKPKTINALMRHLRDDCNLSISGSIQKRQLVNYGYYHGYKGYRFYKSRDNIIQYTDFNQLIAVIDYDNKLKSIFYSDIMFLETALKNIVIDEIVSDMGSASFDEIYRKKMSDAVNDKKLRLRRLRLRDRIYANLSKKYSDKNVMIEHFYDDKGTDVPLWAIFEITPLGDFAYFVSCLDELTRKRLLEKLDLRGSNDTNNQLLSNILYTIKGFRNSVAHNDIIFDTRFKDRGDNKNVTSWLTMETGIMRLEFNYLTDYLILICCLLKKVEGGTDRSERLRLQYTGCINEIYEKLPRNIYDKIVSTEAKPKLEELNKYIKSK